MSPSLKGRWRTGWGGASPPPPRWPGLWLLEGGARAVGPTERRGLPPPQGAQPTRAIGGGAGGSPSSGCTCPGYQPRGGEKMHKGYGVIGMVLSGRKAGGPGVCGVVPVGFALLQLGPATQRTPSPGTPASTATLSRDSAGCLTREPAAVLRRGSETEARPLPAIRTGGGGGRVQCPGSQQQVVPATAPRGHVVPGCSTWSRECGNRRCKSAFVLPESRRPRSIPVPCGGTSQSRTPFPRAVTCGHVSCAGRGDGFPPQPCFPGAAPTVLCRRSPGGQSGNRGLPPPASLPRQCPWSLPGQKG
ncbi:carboxy-terminal domain RNA polymerase II polypeptide A small phosphatase 1 isoform X5 [Corvus kubaryi]|uniref:carboxy-terminal domain RNA polymerase II polypeptide A small phosphatase 1 isoform X5 n=1 Tax=Corvus kubaryi TaxID=68294 RepID=UPI001C05C396|nr:carboxy-terminal domain RNA polymerase II polypeptide A small phosphatase 1 isoform X5 [Corvus kubaryi]